VLTGVVDDLLPNPKKLLLVVGTGLTGVTAGFVAAAFEGFVPFIETIGGPKISNELPKEDI